MDEVVNFYLNIKSFLHTMQTKKLVKERLMPYEYILHTDKGETVKDKYRFKKQEKQRNQIEKGYYKGIDDSLKMIDKLFKDVMKNANKDR